MKTTTISPFSERQKKIYCKLHKCIGGVHFFLFFYLVFLLQFIVDFFCSQSVYCTKYILAIGQQFEGYEIGKIMDFNNIIIFKYMYWLEQKYMHTLEDAVAAALTNENRRRSKNGL